MPRLLRLDKILTPQQVRNPFIGDKRERTANKGRNTMKRLSHLLLILSLTALFFTTSYAQDTDVDTLRASDVNADGRVNILDLAFIASHFNETTAVNQTPDPDINGDGIVNILDLTVVASHFGKTVPIIDFAAEKAAIQEVYSAFYQAFNAYDTDTIAKTFDIGSITFGTAFAGNDPVPVVRGWISAKDYIQALWIGIGTKGAKWGPNDTLSHFWIRPNEASAVGLNCFKGPYPGETQLYLVKKNGQWLIQQMDTITQNNTAFFTWTDKESWRLDKFFTDEVDEAP